MARKKDPPQKAALREMMGNYLKENNVKVKNGTDVNSIMRDMMSIILEGALDQEMDEELGYSKYDSLRTPASMQIILLKPLAYPYHRKSYLQTLFILSEIFYKIIPYLNHTLSTIGKTCICPIVESVTLFLFSKELLFIDIFSLQSYNNYRDRTSVIENIVRSPEASNKYPARKFQPCRMAGLIL